MALDRETFRAALVARHGADRQAKFDAARVAVCGLGGLGSNVSIALARAGVGHLHLIDFDRVEPSNLNRHPFAFQSTLGLPKTEAAARFLRDIAPDLSLTLHPLFLDAATAPPLLDSVRPDILIDAKMNLDAFVDWYNAETDAEKAECARRNLAAVKAQVASLSGKRYAEYVRDGHKTLSYVIMYVANYGALALARTLEPGIVNEAFRQNVLITTEETIMPFLRVLHTAWVNVDQIRNQEKIIKAATQIVERVQDDCEANAAVGDALQRAIAAHEKGTRKLQDGGQSIIRAALEVQRLGKISQNPRKAALPEVEE